MGELVPTPAPVPVLIVPARKNTGTTYLKTDFPTCCSLLLLSVKRNSLKCK